MDAAPGTKDYPERIHDQNLQIGKAAGAADWS